MSDWSMTAWVMIGRFWAALPRLGPDSIAYTHAHTHRDVNSVQCVCVLLLLLCLLPQGYSALPPDIPCKPGWVCQTLWPRQAGSRSLHRPPALRRQTFMFGFSRNFRETLYLFICVCIKFVQICWCVGFYLGLVLCEQTDRMTILQSLRLNRKSMSLPLSCSRFTVGGSFTCRYHR